MTEPVKRIDAHVLTTFEVDPDGACVHLRVCDRDGSPAELVLPTRCLSELLMTLPGIMCEALRNSHGNDAMRVAYPIERYKLELGEPGRDGGRPFILTLETGGGFSVSFAGSADAWADIARSILGDIASHPAADNHRPRLS
jgi:hypothetical protein